ncbi:protein kinase family protein [Streptomyces mirabilis]|uniref:hypothetical protein n=1 Tax=Streptomyces mirabilis TaxID=68239 RepID=UPI0036BFBE70
MPRPDRELSVTREALTPAYAPPEAFHLAEPTPAGDVYSLAATVYALLRGRPPHFPEDGTQLSLAELIVRHTWPYPDLPGVPTAFNEVLGRALVADPARRLSDAGALRDALAAVDVDSAGRAGFGPVPGGRTTTVPARRDTTPPPEPGRPGTTTAPAPQDRQKTRRRPQLIAAVAAVAVSVGVSVTVISYRGGSDTPTSPSTSSRPSVTTSAANTGFGGVSTTARDCPAAAVDGSGGRCVTTPECWSGITDISGTITVSLADCRVKHVWETFAIAPLPEDGMTNNARDLIKHPTVKALCSQEVMLKSRTATGRAVADRWSTDILPPTAQQWSDGLRAFRCVAHADTEDGEITDSHFG